MTRDEKDKLLAKTFEVPLEEVKRKRAKIKITNVFTIIAVIILISLILTFIGLDIYVHYEYICGDIPFEEIPKWIRWIFM